MDATRRSKVKCAWDDTRTMTLAPYIDVYEQKLPEQPEWTGLYDHRGDKIMYPTVHRRPIGFLHRY